MKKLSVLFIVLCLGCSDSVYEPIQRVKIAGKDLDMNFIYSRHDYGELMPTDNSYLNSCESVRPPRIMLYNELFPALPEQVEQNRLDIEAMRWR